MSLPLYRLLRDERRYPGRVKGLADYVLLYALAVLALYLALKQQWLAATVAAILAASALLLGRPVRPKILGDTQ